MPRLPISSFAAGTVYATVPFVGAQNPTGARFLTPGAGVSVQVYLHGTTTPATIYSDESSGNTETLPLSTGAGGVIPGWIDVADLPLDVIFDGTTYVLPAPTTGVTGLTAADATITIGGTSQAPTVKVASGQFDAAGTAATEQSRAEAAEALLVQRGTLQSTVTPGESDSFSKLASDIAAAIAAQKTLLLPPGTINLSQQVVWASDWVGLVGQGKRTILNFTDPTNKGLVIGPGSGQGTDLGDGGVVGNFKIAGIFVPGTTTPDFIAGFTLDHIRFCTVTPIAVDGFDVGIDLIDNCYGSEFLRPLVRYSGTNVSLRVRTGSQSGDDIHFWNPWLTGAICAINLETQSGDGTSGFYFHGGQYGGGTTAADQTNQGAVQVGKNYQTGTTTGQANGVTFFGGDFEGVIRQHNVKVFCSGANIIFYGTRFNNNGTTGLTGTAPLSILSHANPGDDMISFRDVFLEGAVKTTLIDYVPNGATNGQILESGTYGKPVVFTNLTSAGTAAIGSGVTLSVQAIKNSIPSGTAITWSGGGVLTLTADAVVGATSLVGNLATANIASAETAYPFYSCNLYNRNMIDRMSISRGVGMAGGQQAVFLLNGLRIRKSTVSANALEVSTDGETWRRPGFGYGAKLAANAVQSIANSSLAQVTLATSIFNSAPYDTGTHANSIAVPVGSGLAGLYQISAKIKWAGNATGQRTTMIVKNGASTVDNLSETIPNSGASDDPEGSVSGHMVLAEGDYVSLYAFQDSGGALNTGYTSVRDIWLSLNYCGPIT